MPNLISIEDQLVIGRKMLTAALAVFLELDPADDNIPPLTIARATISAMKAANATREKARAMYKPSGKEYAIVDYSASDVVSTAFYMWHNGMELEDVRNTHPASVGGSKYLGFAQAITAATMVSQGINFMDDDEFFVLQEGISIMPASAYD